MDQCHSPGVDGLQPDILHYEMIRFKCHAQCAYGFKMDALDLNVMAYVHIVSRLSAYGFKANVFITKTSDINVMAYVLMVSR